MSQHLDKLQVGDSIMVEGPIGKLKYHGFGDFTNGSKKLKNKRRVGLICAGSGLTPHLQLAQSSLLAQDGLVINMLYCNKTRDDIMCLDILEDFERRNPEQFRLDQTLTRHKAGNTWDGHTGRPTADMIFVKCDFPPAAEDVLVCICGPMGFKNSVEAILKENGYTSEMIFY